MTTNYSLRPVVTPEDRFLQTQRRNKPFRRENGAEAPVTDGTPYEMRCRRRYCENAPSGEKKAPEGGLPTGFRTRCALRRGNDAGGRGSVSAVAVMRLPARKWRRSTGYRRDPVPNPPSGAEFSPEGGFSQQSRPKGTLRRRNDAGGREQEQSREKRATPQRDSPC